jgi:mannose-6-phosphate isomerase
VIELLSCTVMPYAWGSRTAIAELTGRPGPTEPEAELWMGAHPVAPSRAGERSLASLIDADPARALGAASVAAFGPRLPFLLKVLAAAEPLSLQAHPTAEQARAGFDDEERRGVPRDAPFRNYKDGSHKPELLCALTRFEALSGFRRATDTLALFDALGVRELEPALAPLRASPDARGLAESFDAVMTMREPAPAVEALVAACRARAWETERFSAEQALAVRLAELYPGDVGIVSALFLNLVELAPGEAIYLDAGNLHAYLEGAGVEIMASSDNVLRGGLTKKHVDVPELRRVLDFREGPLPKVTPRALDEHESAYDTPAREFRLSVVRAKGEPVVRDVRGPEILLCTEGSATVRRVCAGEGAGERAGRAAGAGAAPSEPPIELARGASAFVAAETGRYAIAAISGAATVYRATVNL